MIKAAYKLDEFEDNKSNHWAGACKNNANLEFDNRKNYIRDHHKGLLTGSVSGGAPFGTLDNFDKKIIENKNNGMKYGSRISPFGTDNNEFLKNVPKFDHRQFGNSENLSKQRNYGESSRDEPININVNSVLYILRDKLTNRGTRSWFTLYK